METTIGLFSRLGLCDCHMLEGFPKLENHAIQERILGPVHRNPHKGTLNPKS